MQPILQQWCKTSCTFLLPVSSYHQAGVNLFTVNVWRTTETDIIIQSFAATVSSTIPFVARKLRCKGCSLKAKLGCGMSLSEGFVLEKLPSRSPIWVTD